MVSIQNENVVVICEPDGHGLTILDKKRWTRWSLDERTLVFGKDPRPDFSQGGERGLKRLQPTRASAAGDALAVSYQAEDVPVEVVYRLTDEYVQVEVSGQLPESVGYLALPGSFQPEKERLQVLLPIMQGMLWDGKGPEINDLRGEAGHLGFTMPFIGYLGTSGGLLVTAETRDDVLWWYGKDGTGRFWATNLQVSSLGTLRYDRVGRLYLTDADIVAVAKQYRQKVIQQGRFVSWEEKVVQRPYLERLFGTLMCFIGYCQDDIDYVAESKKLKDYGFDRALLYPGRFNMYYPDIHMGGKPAIDLPRE